MHLSNWLQFGFDIASTASRTAFTSFVRSSGFCCLGSFTTTGGKSTYGMATWLNVAIFQKWAMLNGIAGSIQLFATMSDQISFADVLGNLARINAIIVASFVRIEPLPSRKSKKAGESA